MDEKNSNVCGAHRERRDMTKKDLAVVQSGFTVTSKSRQGYHDFVRQVFFLRLLLSYFFVCACVFCCEGQICIVGNGRDSPCYHSFGRKREKEEEEGERESYSRHLVVPVGYLGGSGGGRFG